ncbi:MAG: hypothetical protein WBD27_08525 [Pyrinomonadaceae bacterium]
MPDAEFAVKVRRQGNNKSYLIGARSFCQYYKIDLTKTIKFDDPRIDAAGVMILDPANATELEMRSRTTARPAEMPQNTTPILKADDDIPF